MAQESRAMDWSEITQELSLAYHSLMRAGVLLRALREDKRADKVLEIQEQIGKLRDEARAQRRAAEGILDG